ncbi:mechanosensitive ion channel protein MscS [Candidatus Pantoea edessiphila]|uniref:Small-conductance mechanosensitive channel n=1 Tax=Candidatus Pantoea edessiphila TaxID=2044610 RepID=A0A2P5T1H0_9GAMM|nr:small-conductance mechanosensitive channel MscS [Candidatus Pantoea edessiphila]PPI88441.1 mechanosensitive ion channel protein MscS [Candidatus Pantoea edessiphila]
MTSSYLLKKILDISSWISNNQSIVFNHLFNIIEAIIIIIIGVIVSRILSNGIRHILLIRNIDVTIADFLTGLIKYSVIACVISAALGRVGIQSTSIITVLGAASLAIGLALQGSLSNLAAGVLLITFYPFRSGEFVDIGGVTGTIVNIQIFSTTLKSSDGKIIILPNSKIISSVIINFSREKIRCNEFIINVSYEANIDEVIQLLKKVVEDDKRVLKDKEIQVGLNEINSSSSVFIVRCWCNINDLQNVYWDLLKNFKIVLDSKNLSIPFSKNIKK